ncbi:kinase-like domain-containing protein [Rhizophagus diaphanus]|nr:kinase-like domain-containing protein [Rhizophagus diaphanus] [Rhizophagus sp. MUCL 43196]
MWAEIAYFRGCLISERYGNVESASQSWFEEAKSHLTISNTFAEIVKCFGLTQNPSNGNYMLVMQKMDINLKEYLQQNHDKLTWKERIRITFLIINALSQIHRENSVHRDLHSGNILYSQFGDSWHISDLEFCGPANKSSTSLYGNLPYIAPEVINGKEYTFKSDIYSISMLMWEISSGQPPFMNYENDCNLAINIINGMRPKIISEIPSEYKSLMEQYWDADPLKRPDIKILKINMNEIMSYYQNKPNELLQLKIKPNNVTNNNISSTSKFINLKTYLNQKMQQKMIANNYPKYLKNCKLVQRMANNQNDNKKTVVTQNVNNEDEDEVYNNPNLHSEEQDEFEIPDDGF